MRDITVEWSTKEGGAPPRRHFGLVLQFVVHPTGTDQGRTLAVIHDISATPHCITTVPITALTMRTGT